MDHFIFKSYIYLTLGIFIILLSLAGLAAAMFLCAPASEEIKTAITNLDPANSADAVNKAPNMHSSIKEKLSQFGTDIADELRKGFHSSYN